MNDEPKQRRKARLIAFYLPQYHPVEENDLWWGKGFTEWTVVSGAKPLFAGHHQPNIPADLGYYDLRLPEARAAQAGLAKEHGIEGFCYWHYWLGDGRRLLERPFEEVLSSGQPDFPFCLGWANHSWKGVYFGAMGRTLVEQTYPGRQDHIDHFNAVVRAFKDGRYLTVDGKPLFYIFNPGEIPYLRGFTDLWRDLARGAGLPGIYFVGQGAELGSIDKMGVDAVTDTRHRVVEQLWPPSSYLRRALSLYRKLLNQPSIFSYARGMCYFLDRGAAAPGHHPVIVPNWDTTPRLGRRGVVLQGSTPELFREHVREVLELVSQKRWEERIVFIRSWNEWGEGNYLEPDQKHGLGYLQALKAEVACER